MSCSKSTTKPARRFTADFEGQPCRIRFEDGEYTVVKVETGAELGYFAGTPAGYQKAYSAAASHNAA